MMYMSNIIFASGIKCNGENTYQTLTTCEGIVKKKICGVCPRPHQCNALKNVSKFNKDSGKLLALLNPFLHAANIA